MKNPRTNNRLTAEEKAEIQRLYNLTQMVEVNGVLVAQRVWSAKALAIKFNCADSTIAVYGCPGKVRKRTSTPQRLEYLRQWRKANPGPARAIRKRAADKQVAVHGITFQVQWRQRRLAEGTGPTVEQKKAVNHASYLRMKAARHADPALRAAYNKKYQLRYQKKRALLLLERSKKVKNA